MGVDPIPATEDSVEFSLYLNFLGAPQTMSGPMEVGESISVECKEPGNQHHHRANYYVIFSGYTFDLEVMDSGKYVPVSKIIATVRILIICQQNMYYWRHLQCQAGQVEEVFPGWQWRIVNPVTRRQEDPFQPFNTTLPPCGESCRPCSYCALFDTISKIYKIFWKYRKSESNVF